MSLFDNDDISGDSIPLDETLVKDDRPFYANQMEDPENMNNYYDWLYGDD